MYKVILINSGIETTIHYSSANKKAPRISSTKLQLTENQANTFNFTIYNDNIGYDEIIDLYTKIKIIKTETNKIKFEGRVLISNENMNGNKFYKEVICESELAYLNDSRVGNWALYPSTLPEDAPTYAEANQTIELALRKIIDNHNNNSEPEKQFMIGNIEVTGGVYFTTHYESSLDILLNKIVVDNGIIVKVRKENNVRYIDVLLDRPMTSQTTITLKKNLKSLKKTPNYETFCTRLIPIGADELTIESINGGLNYVENVEAIDKYGLITKPFEFQDITDKTLLLQKARAKLTDILHNSYISVEVTALDLSCIGLTPSEFEISTNYKIKNYIQNFEETLKVIQLELDLLQPWNSSLTFSNKAIVASTNTKNIQKQVNDIKNNTIDYGGRIIQNVSGLDEKVTNYKTQADITAKCQIMGV